MSFFSASSIALLNTIVPSGCGRQHSFPCLISASFNKLLMQCFPRTCLALTFIHSSVKGSPARKCNVFNLLFQQVPAAQNRVQAKATRAWCTVYDVWCHHGHSVNSKAMADHIYYLHFHLAYWSTEEKQNKTKQKRIFCVASLEFSIIWVWVCQLDKIDPIFLFPFNKMKSYPCP